MLALLVSFSPTLFYLLLLDSSVILVFIQFNVLLVLFLQRGFAYHCGDAEYQKWFFLSG